MRLSEGDRIARIFLIDKFSRKFVVGFLSLRRERKNRGENTEEDDGGAQFARDVRQTQFQVTITCTLDW